MKKLGLVVLLQFGITLFATTPMDEKIPEEKITMIECEYKYDKKVVDEDNKIENDGKAFHYQVYLPKGYYDHPDERFPCIFVASPHGNAPMTNIDARMKKDRWIVIMLVESKNGDPQWIANFISAHDDAVQRFRMLEGMKYCTGFSGGARCASRFPGMRPGFAGIILQGAGFYQNGGIYIMTPVDKYPNLAVYMTMGKKDSNRSEIPKLPDALPRKTPFKLELFDGTHEWAPAECMDHAFDWLEQQLLTSSILEKDRQICINIFKRQLPKTFESGSDFEKYETLTTLEPLIKLHTLDKVPELSENIGKMITLIKQLNTDKNIQVELKAKTAFQAALKSEDKARDKISKRKLDPKKSARELKNILPAYEQIVKSYENTVYGAKAKEKTDSIQKEIE